MEIKYQENGSKSKYNSINIKGSQGKTRDFRKGGDRRKKVLT